MRDILSVSLLILRRCAGGGPEDIDYGKIKGLRLEAAEKLEKVRPENLGQAGRVSGVSPADISVLMIWLASQKDKEV